MFTYVGCDLYLWAKRNHFQQLLQGWWVKTNLTDIIIIIIIIIGIQPLFRCGQSPELSQVTGMALVRCILGKFLGVVCHCLIHKSKGKGHPATARGSG